MLLTAIRLQAAGIGALVLADANHLPVYALLLTFLASVVKQFFDSSALKNKWERDRLDAETRRKWEREDRQLVATTLASNTAVVKDHADTLAVKIEENTGLTRAGITAAHAAYTEANDVNQKLERLGVSNNPEDGQLFIVDKIVSNFPKDKS